MTPYKSKKGQYARNIISVEYAAVLEEAVLAAEGDAIFQPGWGPIRPPGSSSRIMTPLTCRQSDTSLKACIHGTASTDLLYIGRICREVPCRPWRTTCMGHERMLLVKRKGEERLVDTGYEVPG